MKKIDLTKEFRSYYRAKTTPEIIQVEEGWFLTIEGKGSPEGKEFKDKIAALYSVAYGVKKLIKAKEDIDLTVAKLEGLWWVESNRPYIQVPRSEWRWKLLVRQPGFVSSPTVEEAKGESLRKKKMALIAQVGFEKRRGGTCVQILHVGPYKTEMESLKKMYEFMSQKKLIPKGPHHEIYLSDPRRSPEEKLRTILRQAVEIKV